MEQLVEDFGPIKKADVQIKPLTVIIGQNCVGKSYLADLLFSMLTIVGTREFGDPLDFVMRNIEPNDIRKAIGEISSDSSDQNIINHFLDYLLEKYRSYLETSLKTQLESIFGTEINDLIRLGAPKARIQFVLSSMCSFLITLSRPNKISLSFEANRERIHNEVVNLMQKEHWRLNVKDFRKTQKSRRSLSFEPFIRLCFIVSRALFKIIFPEEGPSSVYIIPAGRAGLLEGYNTVQSALWSLSPIAPIRGISMPPIPGPASEFYKIFLQLQGRKGPLSALTEKFEGILRGKIAVKHLGKPTGKTTITYSYESNGEKGETDIIHAASGVKELAVLYLIIREFVKKGDFLIIEEPESHLHPSAQTQLMEIVSILIKEGVRILMTTHSDLLLRKLAQLTGIYRASDGKAHACLNPEDLAVYLLKYSENGSFSEKLAITEYGSLEKIPTFDEVMRELYDKEVSLQSSMQMKE